MINLVKTEVKIFSVAFMWILRLVALISFFRLCEIQFTIKTHPSYSIDSLIIEKKFYYIVILFFWVFFEFLSRARNVTKIIHKSYNYYSAQKKPRQQENGRIRNSNTEVPKRTIKLEEELDK
jgi:hypothetical protein